jgi:hypothetical protein
MAKPSPMIELEGVAVVLRGAFNPGLFHPAWLAHQQLIKESEVTEAEVSFVTQTVSAFRVGPFAISAEASAFVVETSDMSAILAVRDLVVGIFRVLEHCPITHLGINRRMHFKMPNEEAWHRVGHRLVPKDPWPSLLEQPGTQSVSVKGARRGASSRSVLVTVEPSVRVKTAVYVGTNEHFEAPADSAPTTLIQTLEAEYEPALLFARKLADDLLSRAMEET